MWEEHRKCALLWKLPPKTKKEKINSSVSRIFFFSGQITKPQEGRKGCLCNEWYRVFCLMGKLRARSQIPPLQQGSRGPTLGIKETQILRELNSGVAQPNPLQYFAGELQHSAVTVKVIF